jgi:hypothetical protein
MSRLRKNYSRFLTTTGRSVAKVSGKAATGLFHWATRDHSGITERLVNMPKMGFLDALRYIFVQMVISIVVTLATALVVFLTVAYAIPYLLFGSL